MKKLIIFTFLMLCIVISLSSLPTEGLEYNLLGDGTYSVNKGIVSDEITEIEIPATHPEDGLPVTIIEDNGFRDLEYLTEVIIPEGILIIDGWAFNGCVSLEQINIPASVETLGESPFGYCPSVESIEVATGNSVYRSQDDCVLTIDGETLVFGCKNSIIPQGVVTIGEYAFDECYTLTEIIIPEGVISIEDWAFAYCIGLTNITLPEGLLNIGESTFRHCEYLETIYIPQSVNNIEAEAFRDCDRLLEVTLPEGLTIIKHHTFTWCESLKSINIPSTVHTIEGNAFSCTRTLPYIYIPDTVINVAPHVFYYSNPALTIFVDWDSRPAGWDETWNPDDLTVKWIHDQGLQYVTIDDGAAIEVKKSTTFDPNTKIVIIPNNYEGIPITQIADYGFHTLDRLEKIIIPNSITKIGIFAFSYCTGLEKIILPDDGVTIIDNVAFAGCSGLVEVKLPNSLLHIGESAFSGCSELSNITIPNGVITIDDYAFSDCVLFVEIYIPASVESIGDYVFYCCPEINSITVASENLFYRSAGDCLIKIEDQVLVLGCQNSIIPNDILSIGICAFSLTLISNITLPQGLINIDEYAFELCIALTGDIIVPNSVETIQTAAFWSCNSLNSIYIPKSVINMGGFVFEDCDALTIYTEWESEDDLPETWDEDWNPSDCSVVWGFVKDDTDENDKIAMQKNMFLFDNYPNPFNPSTTIKFSVTSSEMNSTGGEHISINIYNIKGQKVKTLANKYFETGVHSVVWNGDDDNGHSVSSGMYFYKMNSSSYSDVKKMMLLK
jgi:hypothetical protein